jgi:hypothetical protein
VLAGLGEREIMDGAAGIDGGRRQRRFAVKSGWLFLALYSLTVVFRLWYFWQRGWRSPLKSGDRYFMEVEVPDGWHSSAEGKRWWRRYRATIVVPHLMEALAFMAIAVWGIGASCRCCRSWRRCSSRLHRVHFWWRRATGSPQTDRVAVPPGRRLATSSGGRQALMLLPPPVELGTCG